MAILESTTLIVVTVVIATILFIFRNKLFSFLELAAALNLLKVYFYSNRILIHTNHLVYSTISL